MLRQNRRLIIGLAAFALMIIPLQAQACTLWAAAGQAVDGGGTLIPKSVTNLNKTEGSRAQRGEILA